ncbi:hypothetical protein G6F37_000464 [Rhizopus arrhizus]|nr:hypothetical protein G6F38_002429 [Rhizopus arrhizus]KAG1164234.1 hypothetical protein G6F37_000464 [Rhizopus arrhizus]
MLSRTIRRHLTKLKAPISLSLRPRYFHTSFTRFSQDASTPDLDHRTIGKAQSLFMIHPVSPGSIFMLPHGTRIVRKLQDFLRSEYARYGYEEVMTPLIYKKDLWETSGHWQNYKDDMYMVKGGDDDNEDGLFGLKPMNCPGHCLIFDSTPKSYRDLPIRLADFSPLHRNEASGALSGLTRVRRFHQDDAHIFCTQQQIAPEITSCLSFVDRVYKAFQFPHYDLTLSTRPESFIGRVEEWDLAEKALREALDATGRPWTVKEGDGAFYGPKIDIMVKDSGGKSHQTATIQLDFQLPQRFQLSYVDEQDQAQTPVIVHRAILGSIERMMAILIEHTAGKWPFWLSPRQGVVIPISTQFADYAQKVASELSLGSNQTSEPHYFVDVDQSPRDRLNKMIRQAQLQQYNFIFVVGQKEMDEGTVNVRTRKGQVLGTMSVENVRKMFGRMTADLE